MRRKGSSLARAAIRAQRLARAAEATDDWEAAARWWYEAIAADPRDASRHFRLGCALEQAGNPVGAVQAFRDAIARDPSDPRWHFKLGEMLRKTGEWGAARQAHREAVRRGRRRRPTLEGRPGEQLPFIDLIELGVVRKPAYAYGLFRAAKLASRLGVEELSVLELGVAGGRGLLALERHARDIGKMFGVRFDVFGLDTGQGLLAPEDHRDLPYHFAEGNYAMDEAKLRERLKRAELILGDAAVTFGELLDRGIPPIGFISFDMDLYGPTAAVLSRCGDGAEHGEFLPRLSLYFDDVVGDRGQDYNQFTGELLAIDEFNEGEKEAKIAEDRYFRSLPLNFGWHHCCYMMHRFSHPRYDEYVHRATARWLRLK